MKLFASFKTSFVVWVWNHTPSCTEMSRLTSRSFDESLPLKFRLQMWLHHLICIWCKRYFHQLSYLHRTAPMLELRFPTSSERRLSSEARRRISQQLAASGDFSNVRNGA